MAVTEVQTFVFYREHCVDRLRRPFLEKTRPFVLVDGQRRSLAEAVQVRAAKALVLLVSLAGWDEVCFGVELVSFSGFFVLLLVYCCKVTSCSLMFPSEGSISASDQKPLDFHTKSEPLICKRSKDFKLKFF
ncbi:hypothetical protein ILYODFUR_022357 [Ilyodon furcidens]|uniref:Uncharacterized protein n=1 Tax=Ilyodon furcidens TaxID=33524 RepID=A0ABV0TAF3_9TELE